MRAKAEGPRTLGVDPTTGQNVYVMNGRFGAYVQLGETPEPPPKKKGQKAAPVEKPKRSSLQAGMTDQTVTLEEALKLLSLPRTVGLHPDDNEPITTNFGRFGPYVKHGDEFRSLESEDDVFSISFDAALELLRAPKQSRRRQGAQKKTLRELTQDGTTHQAARRTIRPLRHRRPHQRVDSKDDEPRRADLRAGRGVARRAPWCGADSPPRRRPIATRRRGREVTRRLTKVGRSLSRQAPMPNAECPMFMHRMAFVLALSIPH